jgi:type II secretion system protein H
VLGRTSGELTPTRESFRLLSPSTEHRAPSAGAKRPNGFTLIELLVVLIGLAVIAGAIVPALRGAGRLDDLDRVAARVAATARYGRETAVLRRATMLLTVETEPDGVRLAFEDEGETAGADRTAGGSSARPLPDVYEFVRLPSRIHARMEPAPEEAGGVPPGGALRQVESDLLRFPPDGRTAGGAILLADDRGRERRIVVTPETGVVRTERGDD